MTHNFHPSPSIDSKTLPMDANTSLLSTPWFKDGRINENGTRTNADVHRPSTMTATENCFDYDKSGKGWFRWPTQMSKKSPSGGLACFMQLKDASFYQALLSEFIGTLLLTLVCTSTGLPITTRQVPDLHGALVSGFIVATIVVGFGHVSGAHINPAVTVSFLVACKIDLIRGLFYICFQLLGAISGSCLLRSLLPPHVKGNLGMTTITEGITIPQAFVVEFIITFMLCYTVHAICDKRRDDIGGSKALAVGLVVSVGVLFGGPYTGASMNPARSLGPATVMNIWENHWLYWFAPLTGSIAAAILYTRIFKQCPRPINNPKDIPLDSSYPDIIINKRLQI